MTVQTNSISASFVHGSSQAKRMASDIDNLLFVLPPLISDALHEDGDLSDLLEVVMDLNYYPKARYLDCEVRIGNMPVTQNDLDYVANHISEFGDDNRSGIEKTLHRIAAIRNRKGKIIGLTCRVGRAIYGTAEIIKDIILSGKSVLLLGKPGIGKTTILREVARILSSEAEKRVIIVDTSNEIAGDGDMPHPGIGTARRMQVARSELQHAVMIEAVENHMPEVIIIDEISSRAEAMAARTISERGVQLIGTAHGLTLENMIQNPALSDLVGGIQNVTLGDEEARQRGTQKCVLERKASPAFNAIVEIWGRDHVVVHTDTAMSVDTILKGHKPAAETRIRENGKIRIHVDEQRSVPVHHDNIQKIFTYGVSQSRVEHAAQEMKLPVIVTTDASEADIFMTAKASYRKKSQVIRDAESANKPVYILKSNTPAQVIKTLASMFGIGASGTQSDNAE